jgi:hypothetical protein
LRLPAASKLIANQAYVFYRPICVYDGLGAEWHRETWRACKPDEYCCAQDSSQFAHRWLSYSTNIVPTNIRLEESGLEKIEARRSSVLRLVANTLSHSDVITKPVNPVRDHYSAASVIGVSASPVMPTPTISTPMVAVANRNANVLGVCNSDAAS